MNVPALLAAIAKGNIESIYVLSGDESYARRRILSAITAAVVEPSMADFNFERLSGLSLTGNQVVDAAGTMPMMAERRLVLVEETEKWKTADWLALKNYAKEPSTTTCLVVDTAKGRLKPWMNSSKIVKVVKLTRPRPWELPEFIDGLAKEQGLKLSRDAGRLLAEFAGDELEKIVRDLEVLGLYKGDGSRIEEEDVAAVLGRTRTVTQWELNQFVGSRDLGRALTKMDDILSSGHDPIAVLSVLINHMRQLWMVKTFVTRGVRSKQELAQAIGLPAKIAGDLMDQQRLFSNVELRNALAVLHETDLALKSARLRRDLILARAITQIVEPSIYTPPSRTRPQRVR